VEDVRPLSAEQPVELDEAGEIAPRADWTPDAPEWHEACSRRRGRVTKWACSVCGDSHVERADERGQQRGDVRLRAADLGERDQQQQARPPRAGC
jgi:hypothetical protein